MTHEKLRELLSRVHEHLSTSGSVDAESRRMLGALTRDIERALGRGAVDPGTTPGRALDPAAAGTAPRLESLAVRFEAGHPGLAKTLRELIDALVKAGI
jgi:AcrR family transcriptional regulator